MKINFELKNGRTKTVETDAVLLKTQNYIKENKKIGVLLILGLIFLQNFAGILQSVVSGDYNYFIFSTLTTVIEVISIVIAFIVISAIKIIKKKKKNKI